jgi:hypothetical protein
LNEPFLNPYDLIKVLFWPFVIVRIYPQEKEQTKSQPSAKGTPTTTTAHQRR